MTRPAPPWTPPLRDGVAASRLAVSAGSDVLLADYLAARLRSGVDWPERMARGEVLGSQGEVLTPEAPCVPGSVVWYWRSPPPEHAPPEDIQVLHQDAHIVAIDKPHFMSVTPGGRHLHQTALVRLRRLLGLPTLVPMHRLDRETAGVLLFVVRPQDRGAYHALLRQQQATKVYEAVAPVNAELSFPLDYSSRLVEPAGDDFMQMQSLPGEPNAHTRMELVRHLGAFPSGWPTCANGVEGGEAIALYRLLPSTGRKHQLRVHMNSLGIPILGDRCYPRLVPEPAPDAPPDWRHPLQLLAREIAFTDPVTGEARRYTSARRLVLDQSS